AFHKLSREPQLTRERAEAAIAIATEQGFSLIAAEACVQLGWALVQQNQPEEGILKIGRSIGASSGAGPTTAVYLSALAEAYHKAGQSEAGLRALNDAANLLNKTGIRYNEAELYRLKGELLLMENAIEIAEAENCFRQAIEVARKQSAKSWELRATTSLARLL